MSIFFFFEIRNFRKYITVVTPGLLQKNFQKGVTVREIVTAREILLILVVFWDNFIFFVALLTIVTLFAVFLFVLNYFWHSGSHYCISTFSMFWKVFFHQNYNNYVEKKETKSRGSRFVPSCSVFFPIPCSEIPVPFRVKNNVGVPVPDCPVPFTSLV